MTQQCRAMGCTKTAGTFGVYCSTHSARRRKHGDELQRGITAAQLKPFIQMVRARRAKNPDNPAWPALVVHWEGLVDHAKGVLAEYEYGRPMIDHKRLAAEEVVRVGATVDPWKVVETALAVVMMWQLEPRAFMSDEAFKVQMVRRVLRLSPANAQTFNGSDRPKRVYRDLLPKTAEIIASWLVQGIGGAGLWMADLEKKDLARKALAKADLNRGLEDMK